MRTFGRWTGGGAAGAPDPTSAPASRASGWLVAGALLGLTTLYRWQPQKLDFLPRRRPCSHPWTDPDSARLFSPGTDIVIVTAHPDDTALYIPELLTRLGASGAEISLLVATGGDSAHQRSTNAA